MNSITTSITAENSMNNNRRLLTQEIIEQGLQLGLSRISVRIGCDIFKMSNEATLRKLFLSVLE